MHWSRLADSFSGASLRQFATAPTDVSDIIANLLFYVPLGFALLLQFDRRRNFIVGLLSCAAIGAGVSFLMEWLQHLVPGRTPSLRDVVLNVISTSLGAIIGYAYHRIESSRALRPWLSSAAIDPVVAALLACWIAVHSIPFLPKLGLYRAWEAIVTLRNLEWTSGGSAWWFACYLILASLLRTIVWPKRFWNAFILIAGASLLAQIVFRRHQLEFDECIGFGIALPLVAWFQRSPVWSASLSLWGFIIAGLLVTALYPFNFTPPPRALNWMPFSGVLDVEMQNGVTSLLAKTFLYGGALWVGSRACGNLTVPTTLLVLVTGAIEGLQMWLPTRTPESTDPLMMLLLAGLIAVARQRRPADVARLVEE
jgi:VanZ family protein